MANKPKPISKAAKQLITDFERFLVETTTLAPATINKNYRLAIQRLIHHIEQETKTDFTIADFTLKTVKKFVSAQRQLKTSSPIILHRDLIALKAFSGWLTDQGLLASDPIADYNPRLDGDTSPRETTVYDRRVTVRMTSDMYNHLSQRAGGDEKIPREIRKAIRHYLDTKSDIEGSRAYFTRTMREAIEEIKLLVTWTALTTHILQADTSSVLIRNLLPVSPEEKEMFTTAGLLRLAQELLVSYGWDLKDSMLEAITAARVVEQQQRAYGNDDPDRNEVPRPAPQRPQLPAAGTNPAGTPPARAAAPATQQRPPQQGQGPATPPPQPKKPTS